VTFVNLENMMNLVREIGVERFLAELSALIAEDLLCWPLFDRTPRVAAHSHDGVIELMPTSDAIA